MSSGANSKAAESEGGTYVVDNIVVDSLRRYSGKTKFKTMLSLPPPVERTESAPECETVGEMRSGSASSEVYPTQETTADGGACM